MLKTRSPPVRVGELWRASSIDGVTGRAEAGSRRRVKARDKLAEKGTMV